ncbi:hypothetical protein HMSSN036_73460 [Paenibacillus macerans]|nr:hypothetical protein HMSSN036_73460 [Paenibacillus macerans]
MIAVRFEKASSQVRIIVEDNGDRLADEALERIRITLHDVRDQAETTGMVNIHRRIRITFGEDSGLQTERSELGGLRVTILLADGGDRSGVQNADR